MMVLCPVCMKKGRTVLLQKNSNNVNIASNCKPLTCLTLVWRLMKGIIADKIYDHLDQWYLSNRYQ